MVSLGSVRERYIMQRPRFLNAAIDRISMRLLQRIHRFTHRMPVSLRRIERQRVVVVAPHPDDESIAVGGTLALHRRAGSDVTTLFVTNDPIAADGTWLRKPEAEAAAKVLGFQRRFLGFTDGQTSHQEDAITDALADAIRELRPDVVFCPFPGDHHRDHQAVSVSTARAVAKAGFSGEVWCYEVWANLWPNVAIDISDVIDEKRRAIECYRSQIALMPFADAALGLNRFRGLQVGMKHAEGLFVCSAPRFLDISRVLDAF
jgi:LmbE family N-acetylglucosaminyl deacetylase